MWKTSFVVGLAALTAACGSENRENHSGGEAARGAAAGNAVGGAAAGGSAAAGGQGTVLGSSCPDVEPEAGSPCDSNAVNCRYEVCGDDTTKLFSCRKGQWQLARGCGPLDCPPNRPAFLSDCAPLEGIECHYTEDCCDSEPSAQSVFARCEYGQWTLRSLGESCSFCKLQHEAGVECGLPPACGSAGCYRISCYGQPYVEECVDGLWRTQTLCSK